MFSEKEKEDADDEKGKLVMYYTTDHEWFSVVIKLTIGYRGVDRQ